MLNFLFFIIYQCFRVRTRSRFIGLCCTSRGKDSSGESSVVAGPLHLLIDSTGIKIEGEGEWHARKHGGPKRRVRCKIHLGIDEETLEVRAVEITGSHIGDAPVLPDLLRQIPEEQDIGSVTADGAYDTRKCHDAIADRGAHAVIPPPRTRNPGRPSPPEPWPETRPCGHRSISAVPCGDDGVDITVGAASRRRCIV